MAGAALWAVLWFVMAGYLVGGVGHGVKNVLLRTLIQQRVQPDGHGRAFAAYNAARNTAELGALLGGKRIVDESVRDRMAEVLREVRAGRFADELRTEEASGYARLEKARAEARETPIERTFKRLDDGS